MTEIYIHIDARVVVLELILPGDDGGGVVAEQYLHLLEPLRRDGPVS